MNTKSALIIAIAIVIGFSIEPILDRVDFSDPGERFIKVVDSREGDNVGYAYEFYVRARDVKWNTKNGRWYSTYGNWYPADAYALKTIIEMHGLN